MEVSTLLGRFSISGSPFCLSCAHMGDAIHLPDNRFTRLHYFNSNTTSAASTNDSVSLKKTFKNIFKK